MANIIVEKNTPSVINIDNILNPGESGYWKIVNKKLVHNSSVKSYIDKQYDFLEIGKSYRITYNAVWTSCSYGIIFGDIEGEERVESGEWTEDFVFSGNNKLRFWSNGKVEIDYIKIEELKTVVTDEILELDNIDLLENKSFTLSYYPIAEQYVSYHSYLPNNYISSPGSLLVKDNDTDIKEFNKGLIYGKYLKDSIKPFIVETIFNDNPIHTKVFDNITINLKSSKDGVSTNKFFDSVILSNEYQLSGEIFLNTSNLTKKERNWMINKFLDLTNNTNNTLFTKKWSNTKLKYPIDSVVNNNKLNYNKPWYQRARFRDKFIKIRFIENNLENQKIICNFVATLYRVSQR